MSRAIPFTNNLYGNDVFSLSNHTTRNVKNYIVVTTPLLPVKATKHPHSPYQKRPYDWVPSFVYICSGMMQHQLLYFSVLLFSWDKGGQ